MLANNITVDIVINSSESTDTCIDYEWMLEFCERGKWIGPYYYYLSQDGRICQSTRKSCHYDTLVNARLVDELVDFLKERHRLTVDYFGMGMSPPLNPQPVITETFHAPVEDFSLDPEYPERFLEVMHTVDKLELEEVEEDLNREVSFPAVQQTKNYYEFFLFFIKRYVAPLSRRYAVRSLLLFKRIIVTIDRNPMGLSLLTMEREFAKMIKCVDYVFASSAASFFFPATNLRDPLQNFDVTYTIEPSFFFFMSWPQANRCRLVCKRWYKVYKEMYHSNKVYCIASYNNRFEWKKMVTRSSYLQTTDRYAMTDRTRACARCLDIVCSCRMVDTVESPEHLTRDFFYGQKPVTDYLTRIEADNVSITTEAMIALGSLFCQRHQLPVKDAARITLTQLPLIMMMQTRFTEQWHRRKIFFSDDSFIKWRGNFYKIRRNKKKYFKKSKLGDYRTKLLGGHKILNDPH